MTSRGSHRPSLRTIARRTLERVLANEDRREILVAASGGPDSQALLDVVAGLRDDLGLVVRAHGVDHGLRPAAAGELDLAEALAGRHGIDFTRTKLRLARGGNIQARARAARYAALRDAASGAFIATGHHADDRAETVLLRMLRGTSLGSLAVLPPRAGDLVRPLVAARKSDVLLHLARHRIESASDPSNDDPRFVRSRLRREVMPVLASIDPRVIEHLCAIADEAVDLELGGASLDLPKPTRDALTQLVRTAKTSPEKARRAQILLPGGLVFGLSTPHAHREHRSHRSEKSGKKRRIP